MANTEEKEFVINREIWWIESKIIDAHFILYEISGKLQW